MKILVIRFSSIGDIVLTSPVLRCLKKQLPKGSTVDFLCKKNFVTLLEGNPNISQVFTLDKDLKEILPTLKLKGYDAVVDLHNNIRSFKVKRALGCNSYTFSKLNFKKFLLVQFKVRRLPNVHIVERCFDAVKSLGIKNDGKGLELFITETEAEVGLKKFQLESKSYTAIALGAAHFTKRIPLIKLQEIITQLQGEIVLLGGKEDVALAQELENTTAKPLINACGILSLKASAGMVKNAKCLITPDTGLMHIAAAFNTPIYSVWGNTVPEFGMYPYSKAPFFIKELKDLSCRPCSKIGYKKCPKGHFKCMMQQDFKNINAEVNSLLVK